MKRVRWWLRSRWQLIYWWCEDRVGRIQARSFVWPASYVCAECGASGVRLWRQSQVFAEHIELQCAPCARRTERAKGHDGERCEQIGYLVPARPVDGSYWGHTSGPSSSVWAWRNLPDVRP